MSIVCGLDLHRQQITFDAESQDKRLQTTTAGEDAETPIGTPRPLVSTVSIAELGRALTSAVSTDEIGWLASS